MRRMDATRLYYGLRFFLSMPTWVVMAVYLVNELHLSPLQLVLMGTAMEAAVFVFEVPTGVVADTYSRRLSLIIGYLGMGTAWLLVGVFSAPWLIIALWAVWGISYTFTSGASQAWITDEVGANKVGAIFLRGARVGQVGAVVGLALQVAIGTLSLRAGVMAGGAITIACGLACIFLMPETGFRRRPREERASALAELRKTAVTGGRFAWAQPIIMLLISVEIFMGMSSEAFDRLKEALFAFTLMEMVTMLVFALTGSTWLAIAALLGVFVARDLAEPLYTTWLNEQITDSSVRATVISISGQANAIGQAGGGPILGVIGNVWGIRAALATGACVIAPALGLYARAIAHHGREPELEELPATAAQ